MFTNVATLILLYFKSTRYLHLESNNVCAVCMVLLSGCWKSLDNEFSSHCCREATFDRSETDHLTFFIYCMISISPRVDLIFSCLVECAMCIMSSSLNLSISVL